MLFAGWQYTSVWLKNEGSQSVIFQLEVDKSGRGEWEPFESTALDAGEATVLTWSQENKGEWVRVKVDKATKATVHLSFTDQDERGKYPTGIFEGVRTAMNEPLHTGLLYGLGNNRRSLGIASSGSTESGNADAGYYELNAAMQLIKKEDSETFNFIEESFAIPENVFVVDDASVLVTDDLGRRWRLPLGDEKFTTPSSAGELRIDREVATERDLFNCHGTFYELPAENADGYAKIRPISSHSLLINDYASYRGLLLLSGVDPKAASKNSHIIVSEDKKLAVWAGVIDDLWKLGKPIGKGGPWKNSSVKANIPSDPYLFGFYDNKKLELTHQSTGPVTFQIQFEPIGHGPWMTWKEVTVAAGETFTYEFPKGFEARWIRFVPQSDCMATAWLTYD